LYGTGMPYAEYKDAMEYEWKDCTDYKTKHTKITLDIKKTMNYSTYVNTLKRLSRYEGVYLYKIGKSTEGRNIYAIEIDMESNENKVVFMFTGQVHAREFAGGTFLVNMFVDLVQKAQTDEVTMDLLKSYKYVAVPIINVDGREALIKEPSEWISGTSLWKAYTNGTDGNRNFPSVLWGQVSKGNNLKWNVKSKPGACNYAGKYAGSNSETKAMIKWLYHYIAVEKAVCLLDMHQQGSGLYAGKGWSTKAQEKKANNLRKNIFKILNEGNYSRTYRIIKDEPTYGLVGSGSSITDYAVSVASGAKFSTAMGFFAYTDEKKEYMLLQITDIDNVKFNVSVINKNFSALTVEIGLGTKYLGNSRSTRNLLAIEYRKYHFDKLLESLADIY
ncbi:MAG: M14 family metallopeptidase, partial [Mobilitalea sp.]